MTPQKQSKLNRLKEERRNAYVLMAKEFVENQEMINREPQAERMSQVSINILMLEGNFQKLLGGF